MDRSNGYEEHAGDFMRARNPSIGPDVVREWALRLSPRATVLELGCGHGVISQVLVDAGLELFGVDASPTLLTAFRQRFPQAPAECAGAEDSTYFDRTFDAVVAWGLLFLLPAEAQRTVICKASAALVPGGRFLFTAPREAVGWADALTGRESRSLGAREYVSLLHGACCEVEHGRTDSGDNYYFFATRRSYRMKKNETATIT